MNKEIILLTQLVANEKNIEQEAVFQALEEALVGVAMKDFPYEDESSFKVVIDRKTGDYVATHFIYDDDDNIIDEENLEIPFGRISAKSAKQIIIQKLREAEGCVLADNYKHRMGDLFNGTIKRTIKDGYLISIDDKVDALLTNDHKLPQEYFRVGDKVRAVLVDVRINKNGPQLILSRVDNRMMEKLFVLEVPEIEEHIIEIKAVSREPGLRAKILVKTNDRRIDPIGACIGLRGKRVQSISEELCGERIDVVLWDNNIGQLVINALSPSEVKQVVVYEERKAVDVGIANDNLAKAIGKNGQNVRLVSKLLGWEINILDHEILQSENNKEIEYIAKSFVKDLCIDQDLAEYLCQAGFSSIDSFVQATPAKLATLDLDEDTLEELQSRGREVLLNNILSEEDSQKMPSKDLLCMQGMSTNIASSLAANNVFTVDDLADLSVDELVDISKIADKDAAALIMQARSSWFAE